MDQIKGAQSIMFREAPYLISAASVAGSKEADGPIGKLFDVTDKDDLFGAQTWEEAESNMQKEACVLAAGKAHVDLKKIRYLLEDLLRQGIATSMGVEALQIPMFGLYGACSIRRSACACIYERCRRIRRNDDRRHIKSFRKCGKRVSLSVRICESETSFFTLDSDGKRRVSCAVGRGIQKTKHKVVLF